MACPVGGLVGRSGLARRILAVAVFVWMPYAAGAAARAERSIGIESFDATIVLDEAAELDVTETIRLRFEGAWNGIHRRIPVEYTAGPNERYALRFTLVGVSDEAGRPLATERSRARHQEDLKILVPGATDAVRTVVIRYRVRRGVRFFPDHDELYWNVTGDEWPYAIGAARATIELPAALENVRVNAFAGAYGSVDRSVAIRVDGEARSPEGTFGAAGESSPPPDGGHRVEARATRPLGIREGLTVAVAWNPGVIRRPSPWQAAWDRFLDHAGAVFLALASCGLPLATAAFLLRRWWREGRDPRPASIVVQYAPPEGLGAAEAERSSTTPPTSAT
jgi:hypothetical protein